MPTISLYRVDDWEALYIDGKLVKEGHSVETEDVLDVLGIEYTSEYLDDFDPDTHDFLKDESQFLLQFEDKS